MQLREIKTLATAARKIRAMMKTSTEMSAGGEQLPA
jgi:hypothetical protein